MGKNKDKFVKELLASLEQKGRDMANLASEIMSLEERNKEFAKVLVISEIRSYSLAEKLRKSEKENSKSLERIDHLAKLLVEAKCSNSKKMENAIVPSGGTQVVELSN